LDSVHRLATHILKNPPKDDSEFSKSKGKQKGKNDAEQKKSKSGHIKNPKAKGSKHDEEEKLLEALTLESSEILESTKRVREFKDGQKRSASELVDQISNICISQGLKDDLKYYVAIHGLYDSKFLYKWNQDAVSKEAIKAMVKNEEKGKYWILLALEHFILRSHSEELTEHINTILKCFYDSEILEEDIILKCYGKEVANKTLRSGKSYDPELSAEFKEKAAPFINWLKEAEEGEEEGEEEEDDVKEEEKEDEGTKKQKELIEEQQRLQEQQLQENKEKMLENNKDSEGPKPLNILDIKTGLDATSLDDL